MKAAIKISPAYRLGDIVVNGDSKAVTSKGRSVRLGPTAFEVLYQLIERRAAGNEDAVSRAEFGKWRGQQRFDRSSVDGYIVKIRRELGKGVIETVRGQGYRLGPGVDVETIARTSTSNLERRLATARDQIKAHSSSSFVGAIKNCEVLLKQRRPADAYRAMALAYINLGHAGYCRDLPVNTISSAKAILGEAMGTYPNMGSGYALRGLASLIYDYDWNAAERDFNEALNRSPSNELAHAFYAHWKVARGSFDEGLEHIRTAVELDNDNPMIAATESRLLLFAGQVSEAVQKGKEVIDRFDDFAPAHDLLGHAYCAAGLTKEAIEQYKKTLEIDFIPDAVASLGFVYGRQGNRREALKQLIALDRARENQQIAYVSSYFVALVRAGLGDTNLALNALEKAFKERCDWMIYLAVEPRWKGLRKGKRYRRLLRSVGLEPDALQVKP